VASDITLLAETSGKNAILISACADIDVAVKDLVQSAFGHAGQKCSAASLAIVVRDVYEDPAFLRQLIDAVRTLRVGPAGSSRRRLDRSFAAPNRRSNARSIISTPARVGYSNLINSTRGTAMESGVKLGVRSGSWSHQHEWFGPVLGVMVAPDFTTAIRGRTEPTSASRRSPITRRGRVRTMDGPDPGRQSLRQPRNHGGDCEPTALRRMAPQQCRPTRKPVVTTTSTRCGVGRR